MARQSFELRMGREQRTSAAGVRLAVGHADVVEEGHEDVQYGADRRGATPNFSIYRSNRTMILIVRYSEL